VKFLFFILFFFPIICSIWVVLIDVLLMHHVVVQVL
jgi:hypothetical protein